MLNCELSWRFCGAVTIICSALFAAAARESAGVDIVFDLPESIECRDATPPEFAAGDYLKVIEGRLRISARVLQGSEKEVVDFMYHIRCPDRGLRFQDYLPNTTLESAFAQDQIEITDSTETAKTAGADVHVAYKLFGLGGALSHNTKNAESSHYREIAPKELVVASGTTDREHGVFFRLRPSRSASLEGAKEFTFLATVPKSWRGDICTISCTARANKESFFSNTVVPAGQREVEIGLYLAGDVEAASLAEALRRAQEQHAKLLAAEPAKPSVFDTLSCQTASFLTGKKPEPKAERQLKRAHDAVADARKQLKQLAR